MHVCSDRTGMSYSLPLGVRARPFCLSPPIGLSTRVAYGQRLSRTSEQSWFAFSAARSQGIRDREVAFYEALRHRPEQGADPGQDNGSRDHCANADKCSRAPAKNHIFPQCHANLLEERG